MRTGFTAIELMVALVILAILVTMGTVSYSKWAEKEYAENAQSNLKVIQRALADYIIRTESCTADYDLLGINDPTRIDYYYKYTIDCYRPYSIVAERKSNPRKCFRIDLYGEPEACQP